MIIEQLYPSMQHSIKNMTDRAEQYQHLGIDAIWISPFYQSSGFDNGYDVKDFKDVDPRYGTLDDFKELVKEYHSKDMKVFIDLVINHCSIEHPLFKKAKQGSLKYMDMFHFAEEPLNDWEAIFGGSVWKYIPENDHYVFHAFTEGQIDFNFDNPDVWKFWFDVLRFWLLEMNVDGFRIDALTHMAKNDWNTPKVEGDPGASYRCAPKLEGYLEKLASMIHSIKPNAFIIGEANGCTIETAKKWINNHWMNCVIQFEHRGAFELEKTERKGDTLDCILAMKKWGDELGENNLSYLQCHDIACAYNVLALDHKDIADLLFSQKGHKIIYNFQEWGMENQEWDNLEQINEVETFDRALKLKQLGVPEQQANALAMQLSRENARRPKINFDCDLRQHYRELIKKDKNGS